MDPVIFVGSSNLMLALWVAERMALTLGSRTHALFRQQLRIEVQESVHGRDVYLPVEVVSVEALRRLHENQSSSDLIAHV